MTNIELPESLSIKVTDISRDTTHAGLGSHVSLEFTNGFGASIIRGPYSYGGPEGSYEMAVLKNGDLHYENPVANGDVRGWLSESDVLELLEQISNFNATILGEYARADELRLVDLTYLDIRNQIFALSGFDPSAFSDDEDEAIDFDVRMTLRSLFRVAEDAKDRIRER